MKIRVTIVETKQTYRTYEIDGVNDIEAAKKCAYRCATHQFQPNAYMMRQVPYPPSYKYDAVEIVDL